MPESLNRILLGDVQTVLRRLETASVDMCLTSPPYYRLRDYGAPGQLGLEAHVDQWASHLRDIAREIHRVLVPTGTLWLNLGDSYATHPSEGAPTKGLLLGPERVARLLQEDGWILRNTIIWAKPNAMPTSVRDRLAATHETIYLFAKQPRYFFDLDAVRIPHAGSGHRLRPARSRHPPRRQDWRGPNAGRPTGFAALRQQGRVGHPLGKNPGDVWIIPTAAGAGSHHAAFPGALAERCIRAGAPAARCATCKSPWTRPIRRLGRTAIRLTLQAQCDHLGHPEPGVVLDPFIGSGTTGLVAEQLGRNWLGIEINAVYAEEATERIRNARAA